MDPSWPSCAWVLGEDLSGPQTHRHRSPRLSTPSSENKAQGRETRRLLRGWRAPSKMATLRVGGGYRRPAGTHHGHYTTVASFSGLRCPVDRGQAAIPQGRVGLPGPWVPPPGKGGVTSRGRQLVTALGFNKHDAPASTGQVWDSCGPNTEHQMRVGGGVRGVIGDTYPQAWSPRSRCWGPAPPAGSVVSWFQVSLCPFLSLLSPCLLPHEDCSPLT